MASFTYVAKTRAGDEVNGYLVASDLNDVVRSLHGRGLTVLHIAEDRASGRARAANDRLAGFFTGRARVRDLALFCRQFATILDSGIPLVRGLRGLAADTSSRVLSRAIRDIADRIERGESLPDAMAAHPESFNAMFISLIRAGERAGTLDEIVDHLAIYLEKVDAIRTKVRAALAYPTVLIVFSFLVTLFLLVKIVPTFAQIYAEFHQELPALTLLVLRASNAISSNAALSLVLFVGLLIAVIGFVRTKTGRYGLDFALLHAPVFGPLVRKSVMSRCARTLGILIKSGLPILESLDLLRGAAGNAVIAGAVARARIMVSAGGGLTESFRSTGKFSEMTLQLMSTGEESGNLDAMLLKSSDFYDRQVEGSVQALSSLIEPVMIILIGGVIGLIVISMFLPIFHLGDVIMKGGHNF